MSVTRCQNPSLLFFPSLMFYSVWNNFTNAALRLLLWGRLHSNFRENVNTGSCFASSLISSERQARLSDHFWQKHGLILLFRVKLHCRVFYFDNTTWEDWRRVVFSFLCSCNTPGYVATLAVFLAGMSFVHETMVVRIRKRHRSGSESIKLNHRSNVPLKCAQ